MILMLTQIPDSKLLLFHDCLDFFNSILSISEKE